MKFDTLTPHLISLSKEVGKMIMSHYKSNLNVVTKADKTPLTLVDQKAHRMITQALAILTPGVPILSEESESIDFTTRSSWNEYWLIDPLDGTRDFINQTGEFCICIAYIKHNRPIYGLIYSPTVKHITLLMINKNP
jgi:3'(2'), 5'-bisphosphate nucleotidase